jgi:hypothetical protein
MADAQSIKIRKLDRSHAKAFWKKARDFYQVMELAKDAANWNAVGLAAVHCVISTGDAVLVKLAGLRSTSENHRDTVALLRAHVKREGVAAALRHMETVLAMKSDIEYSEHELLEARALELVKHAERFFAWADELIT